MRRQTSSVGQVVPPKVTSLISASPDHAQEISPLAVTPNCWTPIAMTSSEETGQLPQERHQLV